MLFVEIGDSCSHHDTTSPLLGSGRIPSRNLWTDVTAVAPSPTAKATRFGLPLRQSPAANTPARLVSTVQGGLGSFQTGRTATSSPVSTKPWSFRTMDEGRKSVLGFAPMKTNSPEVNSSFISPLASRRRIPQI